MNEQIQQQNRPQGNWFSSLSPLVWSGLWLVVMAAAIETRPFLPVDETRYLAVAWEMWNGGDFLVPHLNGAIYSQKPPLLFWLIDASWAVFGLNDWSSRLIAPLFGLGSLFLSVRTARLLWPEIPTVAAATPLILFGFLFWTLFSSLTMFDMILGFSAILAINGLLGAWRRNSAAGFVVFAIAIGLGILTKGPAILLSTLPPALLAPWWGKALGGEWRQGWKRWYINIGLALLGGIAIGLAWAIPAAIRGGAEYRDAIFWGQSAGRMVNSFAHSQPWWWYLATLPVLLLPWTLWPATWRSLGRMLARRDNGGLRFCLSWLLPALLAFSAISGKQFHYLLPVYPALALLLARLLVKRDFAITAADGAGQKENHWSRSGILLPALPFLIFGLILALTVPAGALFDLPPWADGLNGYPGIALLLLTLGLVYLDRMGHRSSLMAGLYSLTALSAALVVTVHYGVGPVLAKRYDMRPISEKLGAWQRQGAALAYIGKYHGQFQYMGRLKAPITTFGKDEKNLPEWLQANPDGRVIMVTKTPPKEGSNAYSQPYRRRYFTVYPASKVAADPALLK